MGFLKNNFPTNQDTLEGPESLVLELLARRIRFCFDYFCSGIIWKVFLKKRSKIDHTKIAEEDLDSTRREFSVRGLKFVVALSACLQINFSCVPTWGPIQSYSYSYT